MSSGVSKRAVRANEQTEEQMAQYSTRRRRFQSHSAWPASNSLNGTLTLMRFRCVVREGASRESSDRNFGRREVHGQDRHTHN